MAQVEETFGVNAAMKLQKLMEGLPCKNLLVVNHPEVSPPVHISADRTPLMDGGGAQSSLKMCLIGLDVS